MCVFFIVDLKTENKISLEISGNSKSYCDIGLIFKKGKNNQPVL